MADENVQPAQPAPASPQGGQKTNVMAILSLIFAFLFPIAGLILGIIALVQLGKDKNQKGKGLAIAAIIISVIIMIIGFLFLWAASTLFSGVQLSNP